MKKISLLFLFSLIAFISFAQVNLQSLVKPGTKLIYGVEANGLKYDFIVTVKTLVPSLVFDWEMTDRAGNGGSITHTAAAMATGNTMYNYFSPGAKTLDDNTLSVWISKASFTALTKGTKTAAIRMNTNEGAQNMSVTKEDPEEFSIIVNGEKDTIEEMEASNNAPAAEDKVYFTFFNSAKMPIILRMKNGFYIALKEIKTK
jgi:hypothetical protein